jgi:hypothetical protein
LLPPLGVSDACVEVEIEEELLSLDRGTSRSLQCGPLAHSTNVNRARCLVDITEQKKVVSNGLEDDELIIVPSILIFPPPLLLFNIRFSCPPPPPVIVPILPMLWIPVPLELGDKNAGGRDADNVKFLGDAATGDVAAGSINSASE